MKLTKSQEKAIYHLSNSPLRKKFYWTGGTLLAYHYLHHRVSLDLDFFTDKAFSFEEVNSWAQKYKKEAGFTTVYSQKIFDRWEFIFENKETLRIEFVYYNDEKKTLGKRGALLGVVIDSLQDIAANKVMAYLDRNEPKDLFDIYFLITRCGLPPRKLIKLAGEKFGVTISESLLWSESFKSFSLLKEIRPLMLEKSEKEKGDLLKNIGTYFKEGSRKFLDAHLG